MEKLDLKKVNFDDISSDMVLTSDVYNVRGLTVAKAGMYITEENYERLLRHGISVIDVSVQDKFSTISPEKLKEFRQFSKEYEEKEKEVEQCLESVVKGEEVNIDKTFKIVDDIMSGLKNKRDIFLYLDFMRGFDDHTFSHCNNVALLCNIFGSWINLKEEELVIVSVAGVLHDIGKTQLPIEILNKPGKLTPEEYKIVQGHTKLGYQLLKNHNIPTGIKMAALSHHEKIDGSGYPLRLPGSKIDFFAKIVAICDIFDAMTSKRAYHDKQCPFDVIHSFESGRFGELDTELLLVFLRNIASNYVNSWVTLSSGVEAEVIFINQNDISRPMVRTVSNEFINLAETTEIKINKLK